MLPVTGSEAVAAWDRREIIDAVQIVKGLPPAQTSAWGEVMEILRAYPIARDDDGKTLPWQVSKQQFDSWCRASARAWPASYEKGAIDAADVERCEMIRGYAFAILREGFANVINRKKVPHGGVPAAPPMQIQKVA